MVEVGSIFLVFRADSDKERVRALLNGLRAKEITVDWGYTSPHQTSWRKSVEQKIEQAPLVGIVGTVALCQAPPDSSVRKEIAWAQTKGKSIFIVFLDPCFENVFKLLPLESERPQFTLLSWTENSASKIYRKTVSTSSSTF
jgi:hypothetical protein